MQTMSLVNINLGTNDRINQNHQQGFVARQKAATAIALVAIAAIALYFCLKLNGGGYDPHCSREYCAANPIYTPTLAQRGDGPCICPEWTHSNN